MASIRTAAAALSCLALTSLAHAAWPDRPIVMVVPQPPGGAADAFARPFAQALSQRLGQPVVIENRAGANGNIAAAYVAKQPADGYTIFFGSVSTLAVNPHLYKSTGFDPLKDFAPITLTNQTPNVLVVNGASPYRTVADVVKAAKAAPGTINYGSAGNGNTMHLTGVLFEQKTGARLTHVPYKGGPAALTDVMGGQIPMMFHNLNAVLAHEKSGKVRIVAVADNKRAAVLPDVPTMKEAGAPGVVQVPWSGMLVRAGTPQPVIDRLGKEMLDILKDRAFRAPHEAQGTEVLSSTPAEFAERLKADYAAMGALVKAADVRID
ncbi:tripartite tricarboxylate transporter substrate binding protein [Cupriavidus sp. AU9028]|uniref:Bug family tripartite tricarboxylate transporter substrate binding protein n=1 Tax=Cupriavidus sp. AU9028 TaxID=2871157 RepID=UPI001C93A5D5|nr:tripartite tricarboxylate transporter substrate binding protein [Cupriavidus sp. AU9028]MBY4897192.1 tripartite tricarboxylate transporter substrate binding protein [Cupriavidus sp. AU9028]